MCAVFPTPLWHHQTCVLVRRLNRLRRYLSALSSSLRFSWIACAACCLRAATYFLVNVDTSWQWGGQLHEGGHVLAVGSGEGNYEWGQYVKLGPRLQMTFCPARPASISNVGCT